MSVSATFSAPMMMMAAVPTKFATRTTVGPRIPAGGGTGLVIECSSRPQKKATAHHKKTRPRKTQPWDIRRGPTVYPPLPELPPEWSLVVDAVAASPPSDPSPATDESA